MASTMALAVSHREGLEPSSTHQVDREEDMAVISGVVVEEEVVASGREMIAGIAAGIGTLTSVIIDIAMIGAASESVTATEIGARTEISGPDAPP